MKLNKSIEFIEENHMYLVDGVITPSVSAILQFINPNKYKNVPAYILNKKAEFGTNVHLAIENNANGIETDLNAYEQIAYEEYLKLREKHIINPVFVEKIVSYKDSYAGRVDMIADVNYTRCLIDIKTTAELDKEYLSWQLGMYKLALEDEGIKIGNCYCVWLPKKSIGEFIKIYPKDKRKILEVLNNYEKHTTRH